jgi:hypothetical protein
VNFLYDSPNIILDWNLEHIDYRISQIGHLVVISSVRSNPTSD